VVKINGKSVFIQLKKTEQLTLKLYDHWNCLTENAHGSQHHVSHELFSYKTDMIFLVPTLDYTFVYHAIDIYELYEVSLLSSKKCLQKLHKMTSETMLGVLVWIVQVHFTQNRS
jgi:hypothetical protein